MNSTQPTLFSVLLKTMITHTVTYFIMGLLAYTVFDYARFFSETDLKYIMLPTNSRWVMAGPLFQPLRGLLFGMVFFLLRASIFEKKNGWLAMWLVLMVVGIFNTFGPSLGSIEGMIYTIFPWWIHLKGLPEIILQSLFLSVILVYWVNHSAQKWLNWVMGVAFGLLMTFPVLGLLVGTPK